MVILNLDTASGSTNPVIQLGSPGPRSPAGFGSRRLPGRLSPFRGLAREHTLRPSTESFRQDKPESLSIAKGTLDVLVLRALSWGAMHGFQIFAWIEDQSGDALELDDSAIYHALYRMEARGLVEASWGVTENGRRARYYEATTTGKAYLRAETRKWLRYSEVVTGLLTTSVAGRPSR